MDTVSALAKLRETLTPKEVKHLEAEAWGDFLDMCIGQCGIWVGENIEPEKKVSELIPTEPYLLGSHSGCCGIWVSGPTGLGAPTAEDGGSRCCRGEGRTNRSTASRMRSSRSRIASATASRARSRTTSRRCTSRSASCAKCCSARCRSRCASTTSSGGARAAEQRARLEREAAERLAREEEGESGID